MLEESLVLFTISACCAGVCGCVFVCMSRGDKVSLKRKAYTMLNNNARKNSGFIYYLCLLCVCVWVCVCVHVTGR